MKRLLVIISLVLLSQSAFSWGWMHRVVAFTAQENCTPATRQVLDRYLDVPLNNIALWTDHFRARPWAPEDYSDAPNYVFQALEHAVSVDENCRPLMHSNRPDGNGEAYSALLHYIDDLANYKERSDSAVVVALKMVTHCVADVHCPGHILYSIDKDTPDMMGGGIAGGYGIWKHKYNGRDITLHALLDGGEQCHPDFGKSLALFHDYLTVPVEEQRKLIEGTLADYIQDAALRSKVVYTWLQPGDATDETFYTTPSHEQLFFYLFRASAYRLAHILNTVFDPEYKGV